MFQPPFTGFVQLEKNITKEDCLFMGTIYFLVLRKTVLPSRMP